MYVFCHIIFCARDIERALFGHTQVNCKEVQGLRKATPPHQYEKETPGR